MPVYDYICSGCSRRVEADHRLDPDLRESQHCIPLDGHPGLSRLCGRYRRDWKSININRVPGGGRA